ncbi:coiled-coil domain-containing protein AGAP005037-like [Centruroides sculpturatus]|uniref:coiled-coil domain-containing protein AGAP005037-like n=1 Tax=Centruroides sculpturatus TaxID=218467 RepID=UPI000C6DE8CA|nr:coiled-coil domain-containing protein AGAP005037-like [Centruroides sculpturatus]
MFRAIVHFRDQGSSSRHNSPSLSSNASSSSSSSTDTSCSPARHSRRKKSLLYQVLMSPLRKKTASRAQSPPRITPAIMDAGHFAQRNPQFYQPPASVYDDDPGIMSEVETSATGFRRGNKIRSTLPVIQTPSKTQEHPLGKNWFCLFYIINYRIRYNDLFKTFLFILRLYV